MLICIITRYLDFSFPRFRGICIPSACFPRTNGRGHALAPVNGEDLTHPDVLFVFATVIGS